MNEKNLDSWSEFEEVLEELDSCRSRLTESSDLSVSEYLFRGHSSSKWALQTTLERFTTKPLSLAKYYDFASRAKTQIEVFANKNWHTSIPDPNEFKEWLKEQASSAFPDIPNMPGYEYLAYLRHHGFPSPLLDWSSSPYVAAFFAFRHISEKNGHVSIYVYMKYAASGKISSPGEPHMEIFGPYAAVHQRHFLQQSSYSLCTVKNANTFDLSSHKNILRKGNGRQDLIWKFNIPASEREVVLKRLKKMNISAYSLFLSTDALMETIATNEAHHIR